MSLCKGLETTFYRVRAPILLSLQASELFGKKFTLGTHPDFHLSESILQKWLQLLYSGIGFLLLLGKGR